MTCSESERFPPFWITLDRNLWNQWISPRGVLESCLFSYSHQKLMVKKKFQIKRRWLLSCFVDFQILNEANLFTCPFSRGHRLINFFPSNTFLVERWNETNVKDKVIFSSTNFVLRITCTQLISMTLGRIEYKISKIKHFGRFWIIIFFLKHDQLARFLNQTWILPRSIWCRCIL